MQKKEDILSKFHADVIIHSLTTLYSITIYTVLYKNKNNFEALFHFYYFIKPIETRVGPSNTEDLSTE